MNPNVSSSLIHFTDRLEYLKGILKDGFRFSYCREEYPKALVNNIINIRKVNSFLIIVAQIKTSTTMY